MSSRYRCLTLQRLESRQLLAGDLDPYFGVDGILADEIRHEVPSTDTVADVVVDNQGRVVVAATANSGRGNAAAVARFLPTGSLDTGFGDHGKVVLALSNGSESVVDVATQPDGKIVLLSKIINADANSSNSIHLTRLLPAGAIDTSFGEGGWLNPLYEYLDHYQPAAVIVGQGGAIYVLSDDNRQHTVVSKHLPSGSLDPSFADAGVLRISAQTPRASDLVQLPDGSLIIAAKSDTDASTYEVRLYRVLSDGTVDSQFGDGGVVKIPLTNDARYSYYGQTRLAVSASQHIFVAGTRRTDEAQDYFVRKLTKNGVLVATFGTGGETRVRTGQQWGTLLQDLEVFDDGSVAVTGTVGSYRWPTIVRLNSAGVIDTTIGHLGLNTMQSVQTFEDVGAAVLMPSGKLVSAVSDGPSKDIRLIGYNRSGTVDTLFGQQGTTLVNFRDEWTSTQGHAILDLPDGRLLTAAVDLLPGDVNGVPAGPVTIVLTRHLTNGEIDLSYGSQGRIAIRAQQYFGALPNTFLQSESERFLAIQDGYVLRIARLTGAGEIDGTFGLNGWIQWELPLPWGNPAGEMMQVDSIVAVADGFILSGGGKSITANNAYTLVKLDRNGQQVDSFGSYGAILIPKRQAAGNDSQVQLQSDGRFVVLLANTTDTGLFEIVIRRFDSSGILDASFGAGGTASTGFSTGSNLDPARQMAVLDDDRIVVVATMREQQQVGRVVAARFSANGQVDLGFGPDGTGRAKLPDVGASQSPMALCVDGQGRLVVSTSTTDYRQTDSVIYRLTAAGIVDTSFGAAGKVALPFGPFNDAAVHLDVALSGDILAAGSRTTADVQQAVYVRLLEAGLPPSAWQNSLRHSDTSGNGLVTPLDAMLVVNYLNSNSSVKLPPTRPPNAQWGYVDVNGDRRVSPLDALLVINELNGVGTGEGESVAVATDDWAAATDLVIAQDWCGRDWPFAGINEGSKRKRSTGTSNR